MAIDLYDLDERISFLLPFVLGMRMASERSGGEAHEVHITEHVGSMVTREPVSTSELEHVDRSMAKTWRILRDAPPDMFRYANEIPSKDRDHLEGLIAGSGD